MKQRILTASLLVCILLPVLFLSGTVFFPIVAALFSFLAVYEMLCCLGTLKKLVISVPILSYAILLPLALFLFGNTDGLSLGVMVMQSRALFLLFSFAAFVLLMFYLFAVAVFARRTISFSELSSSFLAAFYVINSFLAILLIRYGEHGHLYYLLCFVGPWVTDIFAYFTGYFFGRHKLIPEISPKKTIEGSIGGILFTVLSFLLFGFVVQGEIGEAPNYLLLAALGLLVSVLSQIGDLFASLLKRERGIKDFGNIFPGHGGIMDRFDSVLAVSPLLLIVCTVDSLLTVNLLL